MHFSSQKAPALHARILVVTVSVSDGVGLEEEGIADIARSTAGLQYLYRSSW